MNRLFDDTDSVDAFQLVNAVCDFAFLCSDGDPLCWSPSRVAAFLSLWVPANTICDDKWHDTVEAVFPEWLRFAAQRRGLDARPLDLNLESAWDSFADMRRNAADPKRRSPENNIVTEMIDDGIDLDDKTMVEEWVTRYNARPLEERW